jgi:tetratricopeptide (TPR) repeat protein
VRYFRRIGDRLTEEKVRSNLAAGYLQAGNYQEALATAEPAVSFFADAENRYWEAVTASTLAEAYFETGDFAKAISTANRVLFLEETYTQPYAHFTLGLVAKAQNRLEEAEKHFQASQQIATENQDHFLAAYAWRGLGETLVMAEKRKQGEAAFIRAATLFEQLGLSQELERTNEMFEVDGNGTSKNARD